MEKIRFDKRNYRRHNERNMDLIRKSLVENGAGRSILLDKDNSIIAGNGVYEQAEKLGLRVRVIETDGTEIVAVKRTDIAEDDDKRRRLAVLDNSASDSSDFDFDLLQEDFSIGELEDLGVDVFAEEESEDVTEKENVDGEEDFATEIMEKHDYIILAFDNEVDWMAACQSFGIKKVRGLGRLKQVGLGRVLKGSDVLGMINGRD